MIVISQFYSVTVMYLGSISPLKGNLTLKNLPFKMNIYVK